MATIDGTIVLISLPAIFNGIKIDPLAAGSFQYLLWILFGYSIVTATLLVTFGRISDMFGRVRLYNLGFAIFTVGSFLAYLTPSTGSAGAIELITFRIIQGVGGAFLWSNSAAIVTDAFPANERAQALGINMVAALAGSLLGIIVGGVLATINWRFIFLVSVPVGIFGTAWSYLKLKEVVSVKKHQKLDYWGNVTFALGLVLLLVGVTYGLQPYGASDMGWGSPGVIGALLGGAALLIAFPFIEMRVEDPMFRLDLFRNKAFSAGNFAGLLAAIGRGGVQLMLIILLQGIWLPLHGYSYQSTPFWSGIYIIPMLVGFVIMGPISGRISDRRGARFLATLGMVVTGATFILLSFLPYNFAYPEFAAIIFVMGLGGGMFAAPNTAAIMNASPAESRGAASGMRATIQNVGQTASLGVFFSIVLIALAASLPGALGNALTSAGVPQLAATFKQIPPTNALFAAFLGYNPVASTLSAAPASLTSSIPSTTLAYLTGKSFFPTAIAPAFMSALRLTFYIGGILSVAAAVASALRGSTYVHFEELRGVERPGDPSMRPGNRPTGAPAVDPRPS
ncbi:MAG: MFS transporter [Nitrososphaerota archaeon]|jgi:EmrB/QacA subfamily drug resistance transporter|nr:MFS transporter [Nitrososphaerota archaeon]MDG6916471.1 MFS transporter [Nitrososphaerota archaeon]MDG6918814.1 MFS transporter [Nitrososphaerota archaeon]MDG6946570.1 MFS transporter [Nitrososphaerota archaeon]MDG6947727.1 MFS transporter [Nitrososphaerota archaeon]